MASLFIIQEYDERSIPGWRYVDGTVRCTLQEAEQLRDNLIDQFRTGEYCSIFSGTGKFRVVEK